MTCIRQRARNTTLGLPGLLQSKVSESAEFDLLSCELGEIFQIIQILMPACSLFICLKMSQVDN